MDNMHNSDGLHKQVRDTASTRDTCDREWGEGSDMQVEAMMVMSSFARKRSGSWGYLQQCHSDKVKVVMQCLML